MADQVRPLFWIGSSKSGIATPKEDMELIRARFKVAQTIAQELRDDKTHH